MPSWESWELGAPRLPLARERGVDQEIYEEIVETTGPARNPLSPETPPIGEGAALFVF